MYARAVTGPWPLISCFHLFFRVFPCASVAEKDFLILIFRVLPWIPWPIRCFFRQSLQAQLLHQVIDTWNPLHNSESKQPLVQHRLLIIYG